MGGSWGPAAMGAVLGSLYAALNRFGMKRFWRTPPAPLNVVVTGSTKGIGKAIAREFLRSNHHPRSPSVSTSTSLSRGERAPRSGEPLHGGDRVSPFQRSKGGTPNHEEVCVLAGVATTS